MSNEERSTNKIREIGHAAYHIAKVTSHSQGEGNKDPIEKGRIHCRPSTYPDTLPSEKGLFCHILSQHPIGFIGKSVHHLALNNMRCLITYNNEGVPFIVSWLAAEMGVTDMPEGYTQKGKETYTVGQEEAG